MIRKLAGDHVTIDADEACVVIHVQGQVLTMQHEQFTELCFLLDLVGMAMKHGRA